MRVLQSTHFYSSRDTIKYSVLVTTTLAVMAN